MKPEPTICYENILRAIGQGLENLDANSFDLLEASDNEFVVGGECNKTKTLHAPKPGHKKSFLSLFRSEDKPKTTRTSVLGFNFVGLRFTSSDIELLDQKGKVLRSSGYSSPNPQRLSHILRMTGTYLDYHGSRLLRLSWHQEILTLWHINRRSVEVKDLFTPLNLYDQWVHQFKKRKQLRVLKPTGSD
jgi:hypothetical protein